MTVRIPRYPVLSPEATIDWGPGNYKLSHEDMWHPSEAALQLDRYDGYPGDTVLILRLAAHDDHIRRNGPSVAIELTRGDLLNLIEKLNRAYENSTP